VNAQAKIFALIVIKERQLGHDITDIYTQSIGVKAVVFFAKLDAQEGVLFSVQSFLQSIYNASRVILFCLFTYDSGLTLVSFVSPKREQSSPT
jgi:hypothetical protein